MSEKKVESKQQKAPPARTPEELEKRCINLAEQQAERMLQDGNAPTQVLLHYLKLGTSKAELERAKLEHETKLLEAKTTAIKESEVTAKFMETVVEAIKGYGIKSFNEDEHEEI